MTAPPCPMGWCLPRTCAWSTGALTAPPLIAASRALAPCVPALFCGACPHSGMCLVSLLHYSLVLHVRVPFPLQLIVCSQLTMTAGTGCLRSPRVCLWDRPPTSPGAVRLGTALVWRRAPPQIDVDWVGHLRCGDQPPPPSPSELLLQAFTAAPVAEVYAVRVYQPSMDKRYPFTNLLYQAKMYEKFVEQHFEDLVVPKLMNEVGPVDGGGPLTRQRVLWRAHFLSFASMQ